MTEEKKRKKILSIFGFLWEHWVLIALLLVTSIIAATLEGMAISLVFPVLQSASQIDGAAYPFPFNYLSAAFMNISLVNKLRIVSFLLFAITVIKNFTLYSSVVLTSRLKLIAVKHFRIRCINQLMKVGMSYFNKQKLSDVLLVVDGYTEATAGAIVGLVGQVLPQIFTAIILLLFMVLLSWKMTLLACFLGLISSLLISRVGRNILIAAGIIYEARFKFNRVLMDVLNGMKLLRLFSREKLMAQKFGTNVDDFNIAQYKADKLIGVVSPVFETIGITMLAMVIFIGSFVIVAGSTVQLGFLLTFVIVMSRLIGPMKTIVQTRATIFQKIPILMQVVDFLGPEDKSYLPNGEQQFKQFKELIKISNLSFGYNPKEAIVLKDIDFHIRKGTKVGIVGPSGSGKTTLVELLLRFYDPQSGQIVVDGTDLRNYDVHTWRSRIGVVSQDIFLFNDTIRANIAFARPEATREDVESAAKKGYAYDFIKELPNGFETQIGERGIFLSGGQRQRLAIARAILINPEILIFDEATSSLDSESEKYVQAAIESIGEGKTVITIAHRLSTIFNSDNIIVLEAGRLVEQGKHRQLMETNGLYAGLVKMQDLESKIIKHSQEVIIQ